MLKNKQINQTVPNLYKVSLSFAASTILLYSFYIFPTATNQKLLKVDIIIVFQTHY